MEDMKKERRFARESLIRGVNNKKHICETLRMIYDEICDVHVVCKFPDCKLCLNKEKTTELLIDAMVMAKKMQDRLSYYQKKYKDNTGNKAINIVRLTGVNRRNKIRKARVI
jgi:hypothetical protein